MQGSSPASCPPSAVSPRPFWWSPPGHRPELMRHASPVATAEQSYQAFKKSVQQSRDLVSATATLPALQHNLVYELSFLRAVIAWEALVEEVFVTYLLRRPTRGGARLPSRLPARAVNKAGGSGGITVQMAGEILTGDRKFSDWLLEATVKERAKKWFPGDATFANAYAKFVDPLGRTHVKPFDDIVVVRNRIAHSSGTAAAKFSVLRAREVVNAGERHGMGPGQFLRRAHQPAGSSWFEVYLSLMEDAADQLTA